MADSESECGHVAASASAVDRDDSQPVPDPVEGGEHHVATHHPADFEGAGELDEDGVDAGGVIDDDDDGS